MTKRGKQRGINPTICNKGDLYILNFFFNETKNIVEI